MSVSPQPSSPYEPAAWFWPLMGGRRREGEIFSIGGQDFIVAGGLPRAQRLYSAAQAQTEQAFGFKWKKRDTFDSESSRARMREWLNQRYGHVVEQRWLDGMERPLVLDAGCGAAWSAFEYFAPVLDRIRYLGVDISVAVEVAAERLGERGARGGFVQADVGALPFAPGSVDVIFSEGVLHHTDSTERSFAALAPLLRPGGLFMFYVYREKGPVREFTDDYIRAKLQSMAPEEAWRAMEPLTRLGIELGKLNATIEIPEAIGLLDIPAGRMDLQRFFYWHVAKAFWRPDMTFDEMNHINYDWYAPRNAHRHTEAEVRDWCAASGLEVVRNRVEEAGITVVARKQAN
jgi:arsenite methyltransferase